VGLICRLNAAIPSIHEEVVKEFESNLSLGENGSEIYTTRQLRKSHSMLTQLRGSPENPKGFLDSSDSVPRVLRYFWNSSNPQRTCTSVPSQPQPTPPKSPVLLKAISRPQSADKTERIIPISRRLSMSQSPERARSSFEKSRSRTISNGSPPQSSTNTSGGFFITQMDS
jgi:hypothetical protein